MSMYDALFEFYDDAQLIGSTTTDYVGATVKTLDWGAADLEMGSGEPVWLNIRVGTTAYASAATTDTVDFALFADTAAAGHDANSDIIVRSGARPVSELTAGAWVLRVPLPANIDDSRYLSLGATFSAATTAGTINAWLDHGSQSSYDTQVSTSNI